MSIPSTGARASQGSSSHDGADPIAEVSKHLRTALAILDDADSSKEAAAYIQTALDCLEKTQTT